METKAVFFDLDGTLFTNTRNILPSTKRAIAELKERGVLVGVATGRGPAFVIPIMENLQLDFAVTYNGQYIFSPSEIISTRPIDKKSLREILAYSRKNHRDVSFGGAEGMSGSSLIKFGETRTAQFVNHILPGQISNSLKDTFKNFVRKVKPQRMDLEKIIRQPIYQVVMVATEDETSELETNFKNVSITRSNPYSVDIIAKGNSKLIGIAKVGEKYGFGLENVMAFGDSNNDIEMIDGVGIGVAMGNGTHQVKRVANYITDTNNQDGIAKAIAHYGLINFYDHETFRSRDEEFNKVKDFHTLMDGKTQEIPKVFSESEASNRVDFKIEELVEFLYAATNGDEDKFETLTEKMKTDIDKAKQKIISKDKDINDVLTKEVDALTDMLYLTYGSFVLMGVDPAEIFDAVHRANMGKIFPDGQPHFDEATHKVLKPENWEKDYAPEGRIKFELERQKKVATKKAHKLD